MTLTSAKPTTKSTFCSNASSNLTSSPSSTRTPPLRGLPIGSVASNPLGTFRQTPPHLHPNRHQRRHRLRSTIRVLLTVRYHRATFRHVSLASAQSHQPVAYIPSEAFT